MFCVLLFCSNSLFYGRNRWPLLTDSCKPFWWKLQFTQQAAGQWQLKKLRFRTNVLTCTPAQCLYQRWSKGNAKISPDDHTRSTLVSKLCVLDRNFFSCMHFKPKLRQANSKIVENHISLGQFSGGYIHSRVCSISNSHKLTHFVFSEPKQKHQVSSISQSMENISFLRGYWIICG